MSLSRLPPSPAKTRFVGYARVSTEEQVTDPQLDELKAAGCAVIHQEHASGASRTRPVLAKLLQTIGRGETLVVVRLDRLARSVKHLLDVIEQLESRGAHFKSLRDPIDTTTPQGMFSLQVLGAVAQLERSLIAERTKAGIKAAASRGRKPGNPGVRAKDPVAIRKVIAARDQVYLNGVLQSADTWLPTVRRMRPDHPWEDVARVLNASGQSWTVDRLRRTAKRLVNEGLAAKSIIEAAPRRPSSERLTTLVAAIAIANPGITLRGIAAQLQTMNEKAPRGGAKWSASSVKSLLDKAGQLNLEVPGRPNQ